MVFSDGMALSCLSHPALHLLFQWWCLPCILHTLEIEAFYLDCL